MAIKLKRAYDPASPTDGRRYLVERLWPRGVSKERLALTDWIKELSPSSELRQWYAHDPKRWPEFRRRYEEELEAPDKRELLARLAAEARTGDVTLVFATKDSEHSGAWVLKAVIERMPAQTL
jgi:uncharacterized protein YeaO (DUF488 family)